MGVRVNGLILTLSSSELHCVLIRRLHPRASDSSNCHPVRLRMRSRDAYLTSAPYPRSCDPVFVLRMRYGQIVIGPAGSGKVCINPFLRSQLLSHQPSVLSTVPIE